jgi:hypothetical protein
LRFHSGRSPSSLGMAYFLAAVRLGDDVDMTRSMSWRER